MDNNSGQEAQIAQKFSDAELARLNTDKSYAHQVLESLKKALLNNNLDPITKSKIEEKIKQTEQIIIINAKAQTQETPIATTTANSVPQSSKQPSSNKEALVQKVKKFTAAKKALFSAIKDGLAKKKIFAVNVQGEEEEINIDSGLPSHIVGFAGGEDEESKQALHQVAEGMNDACEEAAALGLEVKQVSVVGKGGKLNHFFAILMPEGIEGDPLVMNEPEIIALASHLEEKKPSPLIKKTIKFEEEKSEAEQIHHFKRRIGRSLSVVEGDAKDLHKFHEEQIVNLWKELMLAGKERNKISAAKLALEELTLEAPPAGH